MRFLIVIVEHQLKLALLNWDSKMPYPRRGNVESNKDLFEVISSKQDSVAQDQWNNVFLPISVSKLLTHP